MNFGQKYSEVPHLVKNKPTQKHSLGAGWLGNSFMENDLEVLMLNKLNMSQQCASAAMRANHIPGCISNIIASRLRERVISSIWPLYEHMGSIKSGLILSGMRKTVTCSRETRVASAKTVRRQKHMVCEGRLRELD